MKELNFGDLAMLRWLAQGERPSGEVNDFGDEAAYTKKMRPRKLKKLGLIESVQHHTGQRFGGATVSITAAGLRALENEQVHLWVGHSLRAPGVSFLCDDRLVALHMAEELIPEGERWEDEEDEAQVMLIGGEPVFRIARLPLIEKK